MSLLTAISVALEQGHAIPAAWKVLEETGNPLRALRVYTEATESAVDDALGARLEDVARTGLTYLATLTGWAADGAHLLTDVGYRCGQARYTIERWLQEAS